MKPEYLTVAEMYQRMQTVIRERRDTGVLHAISETMLEPRNPFAKTKRAPKLVVTLTALAVTAMTAIFLLFSFRPW
jgi:hypothetical protein